MNKITLACPAKINLNLSVLRKKIEGMHEINSQFQLINLFDEMKIEKTNSKLLHVSTNIGSSINGEKNIVYQAVSELSKYVGRQVYCNISIKKNIPLGGGLGGGSSNGAAIINFLCSNYELSMPSYIDVVKHVGSDVPFFINKQPATISGIGENIVNLKFGAQD